MFTIYFVDYNVFIQNFGTFHKIFLKVIIKYTKV